MSIVTCVCPHPFQDRRYGSHKRVANITNSSTGQGCRCTVCGKDVVKADKPKKVKKVTEPAKKKKGR